MKGSRVSVKCNRPRGKLRPERVQGISERKPMIGASDALGNLYFFASVCLCGAAA